MEKRSNAPLWAKFVYAVAALVAIAAVTPVRAQATSPTLSLSASNVIVNEGKSTVVTVTRTGSTASALTVNFALTGTATKWNDYRRTPQGDMPVSLVIPAGSSRAQMTIAAVNDSLKEGSETATFTLQPAAGYVLGTSVLTLAVNDPGVTTPPPAPAPTPTAPAPTAATLSLSASNVIVNEGNSTTVTFTRTGSTSSALTVPFALSGTATKWNDYRRTPNGDMPVELIIPAGAASASMTITAVADSATEGSESAIFTLQPISGYTLSSSTLALAINDPGVTTPPPSGSTGVTSPAPSPDTSTPAPTTPTLSLAASAPLVQEGNTVTVTLSRSGDTSSALTVPFALTGTATKWIDYRRTPNGDMPVEIVIPAGAASVAMTLQAVTDSETEGSEVAIFTLQNVAGYTLGTSSLSLAVNDPGVTTLPPAGTGTTTPSTGDTVTTPPAGNTLALSALDAVMTEGGTDNAVVVFTRTGDTSAPLNVDFSLSGRATKWNDYRRTPQGDMPVTITIPAGATSYTMTLTAPTDTETEGSESVLITLSTTSATGYAVASPGNVTLTINDAASPDSGSTGSGSDSPGSTPPDTSTGGTTTPTEPAGDTNTGTVPTSPGTITPSSGAVAVVDYTTLEMPQPGDHALKIVAPNTVELRLINTKDQNAAPALWNFVSGSTFNAPAPSQFAVTVNGQSVGVQNVGFRRRPLYAPLQVRDLRLDNSLILVLSGNVPENAEVEVKNPGNALWPTSMTFKAKAEPMRESGAIHVNQEGYVPSLPKKAMVGHYLGSLGELTVPAGTPFRIVDAASGSVKFSGSLVARLEKGFTYTPLPYQKVMEADFSAFQTPGEYRLVVPGFGASLPFLINDGVAMAFTRTYALGLFHQRCGHPNHLPFTRHVHDACHTAPASIPTGSAYSYTWSVIAQESANKNPAQTAPQLKDEASMLYPFVNKSAIDVSGGHHDAGDYSKYTSNSALLVSTLIFAVDSMPGIAALDNLGLPESGDGIADLLQEAKIEADFLAKLQDTDGGFYFLVYPAQRRYESNVLPDRGDPQIVWPKNTAVTAASVAALAQMSSSPKFKAAYPQEAARYLEKAKLGWQFLMNAFAKHGRIGAYQKITHYGDNFMHDDELAWAAVEMYLATGDATYAAKIKEYFPDPTDANTYRWGWWRMYESYGNAVRSHAFARKSGRTLAALDATYLAKCEQTVLAAGDDSLRWTKESAYPTAFPDATKRMQAAGWYFSLDSAMDMAVAYQLSPKADYIDALVGNMNYEGGTNPVNVSYLTGLGTKRQREIVHQYAQNDRRVLPQSGIPQGNIQQAFAYLDKYGAELSGSVFPTDDTQQTIKYPFYDRWADAYNVATEFVHVNQGRGLLASAFLATLTPAKATAWKSGTVSIVAPTTTVEVDSLVELKLATTLDLTGARIVWEAREQEPAFGPTYTIQPKSTGEQWVEVEVQWPDGRRAFAHGKFTADASVVKWMDDALPAGAYASTNSGGDTWNWVTSNPAPKSGTKAHQTTGGSTGNKEHSFVGASSPLEIGTGDVLFAYVWVESSTQEIMLHWFDGTSWDHRAYWGANNIGYGTTGTASRMGMGAMPAAGQWVRLEIPAAKVGLEGKKVYGMCFSAYGGGATWDLAGRAKPGATLP